MREVTDRQVTLAEAAEILGLSLHQVRRRIRAGELHAERVQRPQGYTYLVTLADGLAAGALDGATSQVTNGHVAPGESDRLTSRQVPPGISRQMAPADEALLRALEMVSAKDAQLVEHEKRIRDLEEQRFQLAGQLGYYQSQVDTLREQVKLLSAPKETPATSPTPEPSPPRRWWQVWRRRG